MRITVVRARGEIIETVQKIEPISGIEINQDDDRIVLLLKNEHYYAIVPPKDSMHKDQELLQKLAQYVSPVRNSPRPVYAPQPPSSISDPIQRKFEAMERELRLLSLRVSEQGVEMRKLKSKQENLDHVCAEHLDELEALKKANEDLTKKMEMSRPM